MPANEDFRVYVIRHEDREAWRAKTRSGDEVAKMCLWAAANWRKAMATEHSACSRRDSENLGDSSGGLRGKTAGALDASSAALLMLKAIRQTLCQEQEDD